MMCPSCGSRLGVEPGKPCPNCGHVVAPEAPIAGEPAATDPGGVPPSTPAPPGADPFARAGAGASSRASGGHADPWRAPERLAEPEAQGVGSGIPWEQTQSFQTAFETIKAVLLTPVATFRGAGRGRTDIKPALTFGVIVGGLGIMIGTVMSHFTTPVLKETLEPMLPAGSLPPDAFMTPPGIGSFLAAPLSAIVIILVYSGFLHLALKILGGANSGIEATIRAIAYITGAGAVFQAVPFLGVFVGTVWIGVVTVLALRETHGTTTLRAIGASVLFPTLAGVCGCCALGILLRGVLS